MVNKMEIEKLHENCKYSDTRTNQYPCNECIGTNKSKWESKEPINKKKKQENDDLLEGLI